MTKRLAILLLITPILSALVIAMTACSVSSSQPPANSAVSAQAPPLDVDAAPDSCVPVPGSIPVRLVVFQDKSGSANETRTQQLTDDDLVRLVSIVCRGGGLLALGLIADDSNRPLVRLTLSAPPSSPSIEPLPSNPLEAADVEERNQNRRIQSQRALKAWRDAGANQIGRFIEQASALLAHAADYRRTDVVQALVRASLALGEPMTGVAPHCWIFMSSDGEDTAHQKGLPTKLPGRLLLVNGAGRTGAILPAFDPMLFEAVSAAIDYVEHAESAPATTSRRPW